jgi:Glycosyl transferase family group 2
MKEVEDRYEPRLTRSLEVISGSTSFAILSFPVWGSLLWPEIAAYFIILFDVYWLYKSVTLAVNATRGYLAIKKANKVNWSEMAEKLENYDKLQHIIFIPTVNEPEEILHRTLTFFASQECDTKKISLVLATEAKVSKQLPICKELAEEFKEKFGNIWVTQHVLTDGEVIGKASNLKHAGHVVLKNLSTLGWDKDFITATSCDADVSFHVKYFAKLSYDFLINKNRYLRFWQGPILFYNNIWRVPMPVRVVNTVYSIGQLAYLMTPQTTFNYSSYSLSWKLLEETGFWDPDVIPEDWHLFFKAFFSHKGLVDVESLPLPLYADAAEGSGYWDSVKSNYLQVRRWAWGITDLSYAIRMYKNNPEVPFGNFAFRMARAVEHHVLWPVNFFILTFGATIPTLVNPAFKQYAIGFSLPGISGVILTFALVGAISIIVLDILLRPPRPESFKKWHLPFLVIQYIFMPITAFIFGAFPGMDAHMRLILGKRLEYKVTEKKA